MMSAYYNEIDPFAAEWLRNLIKAGHITDGVVDERSISDIRPSDLAGYTQCHFFAGIGVWSLALRNAGWSDDRPVWTGSCPCQPFSSAGKGSGFDDERHLWPAFEWLIRECRPATVIGEQVASKDAEPWVDLVQADMEALGYTFGAVPFPSASIGAPHIRDRIYWVGHSYNKGLEGLWVGHHAEIGQHEQIGSATSSGKSSRVADGDGDRCESWGEGCEAVGHGQALGADRGSGGLDDTEGKRRGFHDPAHQWQADAQINLFANTGGGEFDRPQGQRLTATPTGPTNGFWADADWLFCRDGKWRPVEPGTFPLANGIAARVGRLRAYGNAINAEQARIFIETVMECVDKC